MKVLGAITALLCCSAVVALGLHESSSASLEHAGKHSALIGNAMIDGRTRVVEGSLEWMRGGCLAVRERGGTVWMLQAPGNSRLTATGIRLPGVHEIAVGSSISLRGVRVAAPGGTPCRPDAVLFFWSMERQ